MSCRVHSSEIRGLYLMKCPRETLQNLLYFIYTKTQSCFSHFSFHATLFFPLIYTLIYVDIDQVIQFIRGKNKVVWNEKQKKQLWGFVYIKYGKFWSISLELFIKHKPLLSEEWDEKFTHMLAYKEVRRGALHFS